MKMESEAAQGHTFVLQNILSNDGCRFGPQTANTWQEAHTAVEHAVSIVGVRHQDAMFNIASAPEQNHRQAMAQLAGEATRALQEQAREHADVIARLQREAVLNTEIMASYMSVKQAVRAKKPKLCLTPRDK